ncbi:MAG: NADH-quinone oxidoreductase subunit J [Smithellaceae bacterium]|nr:NADH-quinone oxidoreductase subunit J [Smithellaceae bacterium]
MDPITLKWLLFISAALLTIGSAIMMVTRRNPIHSALWLVVTFCSIAVIYLLLEAQFIAAAQVIVYAGAIMMLILFVIMLVRLEKDGAEERSKSRIKYAGAYLTLILFLELALISLTFFMTGKEGGYTTEVMQTAGNVRAVGGLLYGKYLFPFEIASILLLVGIIGAVVLTRGKVSRNKG